VIFLGISTTAAGFALCGPLPPLPQYAWIIAVGSGLEGAGLSVLCGTLHAVVVYPHLLLYTTETLNFPQDDLLSDKISSNSDLGWCGAAIALGMGSGPIFSGLLLEAVGMQRSFWILSGSFAVFAVLYTLMTGLWRRLLGYKEADSKHIEMGYHLVPNPPSA
jgi:MFS family permease